LNEVSLKKEFYKKKILITGGTGSIGIELVKQLLKFKPSAIRILTNDENSIFTTQKKLGNKRPLTYFVGDIRESDRLKLAIRGADIVFHAAAMKHIDICEQNPFDAIKTNVIGTSNVIEASILEDVSKFILISTDKATSPTSTLGASKLLAERLTIAASTYRGYGKTIFSVVRFGNVIGSRGSVFQIFRDQIMKGEPITITDKRMTRFIMSVSDAASLILRSCVIAKDGETYILKMPAVRIEDLGKTMIEVMRGEISHNKLSKIIISKIRDSEKISEMLITPYELPCVDEKNGMFRLAKKIVNKIKNFEQFDSATTQKISKKELIRIIEEVLEG